MKALTKAERAQVRGMFGGLCAYCGCQLPERWHADHFEHVERKMKWALAPNGSRRLVATGEAHRPERDTLANMMPACPPCNIDKHSMTLEDWRTKLGCTLEVLNRNNPTYRHAVRFGLVEETPEPIVFYFERVRDAEPWPDEAVAEMRAWAKQADEESTLRRAQEIMAERAIPLSPQRNEA